MQKEFEFDRPPNALVRLGWESGSASPGAERASPELSSNSTTQHDRWDVRLPASAFRRRGASDVFGVAVIDHNYRTHRSEDAVYAPRYRAPGR